MSRTIITTAITACAHLAFAVEHEIPVQTATPAPDKSHYNILNPTPIDVRRPYDTDRPSKTDSAYTVDAGVFQIETDIASWTLDETNTAHKDIRVRTWLITQTNFKIGLTNWMDLQIFPQGYVNRRTSGNDFGRRWNKMGSATPRFD